VQKICHVIPVPPVLKSGEVAVWAASTVSTAYVNWLSSMEALAGPTTADPYIGTALIPSTADPNAAFLSSMFLPAAALTAAVAASAYAAYWAGDRYFNGRPTATEPGAPDVPEAVPLHAV
jgi:hypothetical protein